ncbi:uncharacterized protein LOC133848472 isoform X1 [Drosophila sulfurigaster albostrigata]|uniref:uncharacterized protein LOC133848472 isoform X1 n=1 Tax=Drosophila sulfurigaster albostrigata TaxID=89887 RepID=UPI002D21CECE|nr:uncharacterized protein LOC133848472 isoform X1 [Drosophila sulfurigaster albostrigata]
MAVVSIGYTSTNGYESDLDGFPYSQFVKNLYRMRRERQQREGAPPMRPQYRRPRARRMRMHMRLSISSTLNNNYFDYEGARIIRMERRRNDPPHSPFEAFCLLLKSLNPKYHFEFYCFLWVLAAFAILAYVTYWKCY